MLTLVIDVVVIGLEAAGVLVMLVGFALATARFLRTPNRFNSHEAYISYRHRMGRSLLLGLDFLIAGDIIKTVTLPDDGFTSIAVLAAIVVIRTFLSMTLHLEVEGRWPWQRPHEGSKQGED